MRSPVFRWLLLLIAAGAVAYHFWPATAIVNARPHAGPIVAFGDSLTSGVGAPQGQAWPDVAAGLIGKPILNRGVAGNTIGDAAARLGSDVLAEKPSIVIVLLGGNDLLRQMDLDQSFAELERMVRMMQDDGALVVLVGLESIIPLQGVGRRYQRIAEATGAVYVPDILDDIFANGTRMADTIHPNADGHRIMAERIAKALKPYL
jgi:acyl-CoA thioesterase-1